MKPNSYPPTKVEPWTPVVPRRLLPITPPPEPLDRPALPTPQRTPSFNAPYTLSTHLIPACYLRRGRFLPVPPPLPSNAPKDERARILKAYKHDLRIERGQMLTDGYPKVLWNCVNRYARNGLTSKNRTGLTLFFAHANGFPKEVRPEDSGRPSGTDASPHPQFRSGSLLWRRYWHLRQAPLLTKCGAGSRYSMATLP